MKNKKPTCISCKKTINTIAIDVYEKAACVDCYNEAIQRGFIARPVFKN